MKTERQRVDSEGPRGREETSGKVRLLRIALVLLGFCPVLAGCPFKPVEADGFWYRCGPCECDLGHVSGPGVLYDQLLDFNTRVCFGDSSSASSASELCDGACYLSWDTEARKRQPPMKPISDKACRATRVERLSPENTEYDCASFLGSFAYGLMSAKTPTASFDGAVDFGRSYIELSVPSRNEKVKVNVKGVVNVEGGNCPGRQCPIRIWQVDLAGMNGFSLQGRQIKEFTLHNAGILDGSKTPDDTFSHDPGSKARLAAVVKVNGKTQVWDAPAVFSGSIKFGVTRNKSTASTPSNLLSLEMPLSMADNEITGKLVLVAWFADCRPKASASASCYTGIDYERRVRFSSSFALLGAFGNRDLCAAVGKDLGYARECQSQSIDNGEFRKFFCSEKSGPEPVNPFEAARRLKFSWLDGDGKRLGDAYTFTLDHLPKFPVSLTVENEWGRKISTVIANKPQGGSCPR